jgi:hypothetical protein
MDINALQTTSTPIWRLARLASVGCFLVAGTILTAPLAGPAWAQASILMAQFR